MLNLCVARPYLLKAWAALAVRQARAGARRTEASLVKLVDIGVLVLFSSHTCASCLSCPLASPESHGRAVASVSGHNNSQQVQPGAQAVLQSFDPGSQTYRQAQASAARGGDGTDMSASLKQQSKSQTETDRGDTRRHTTGAAS